ncbi:MAG: VOC family protein [Solirubrobacteraceae bacterium]
MTVAGIYETVLYTDDLPALARFYERVLGLRVVDGPDQTLAALRLPDRGMLLLFDRDQAARPGRRVPSHGTTGPGHVAFRAEPGSVDAWRTWLDRCGVAIECDNPFPDDGFTLYFRDPAGNSVELVDGDLWSP